MANNQIPIHIKTHRLGWSASNVTTSNTTTDLTSGTIYEVFAASATEDSYIKDITFRALGTNTATVSRLWINNGSTTGTAANQTLYREITLPATTLSQVAALMDISINLNLGLPVGYKLYITLGTTVAAGYKVTVTGGDY